MTTLAVGLGARRYPIQIEAGLLASTDAWRSAITGGHALIVSDSHVAPLYAAQLQATLSAAFGTRLRLASLTLEAGEAHKNLAAFAAVLDALAQLGATRDACVIALGGGVVGDIAGFAAACWMRGIAYIQCPTTLLAMVDSSVGGKTGVDHAAGKNLIGAFHQPRAVLTDLDTLATLPERELRAGLAEVIKTACIGDAEFFAWLEGHADALLARDSEALTHAIATCCQFKARVVERDEREAGERALLNFGHTFGHALETETGYGTLLHGEAVAIGMLLATHLSERLGMAPAADGARLKALLVRAGLPTHMPAGLDADALRTHMQLDKKNRAGQLRLILWRGIGRAEIVTGVAPAAVRAVLA